MTSIVTDPRAATWEPPSQPEWHSPSVTQLAAIFPEIESEVLAALLAHHQGKVESVIAALLDESGSEDDLAQAERDAQIAREVQLSLDSEVAQAVHQDLQRELREERRPSEVALRAVEAATALRKRLASMSVRPRKMPAERNVRLLDADGAITNFDTISSTSALQPTYSPPTPGTATAPGVAANKYESRVIRARLANKQGSRSRSAFVGTPVVDSPLSAADVNPLVSREAV